MFGSREIVQIGTTELRDSSTYPNALITTINKHRATINICKQIRFIITVLLLLLGFKQRSKINATKTQAFRFLDPRYLVDYELVELLHIH